MPNTVRADLAPGEAASTLLGLTSIEAARRLRLHGPNDLVPESKRTSLLSWAIKLGSDPMALLLFATAGTYAILGDNLDAIVVGIALIPIFLVSAVLEVRADAAIDRLRDAVAPQARVRRDGSEIVIPARDVVIGDAILVHEGDVLVADGELVKGKRVTCDESTLTGESIPVDKSASDADHEARLIYAGTTVVAGNGIATVTATGRATQYGKIGGLLAEMTVPPTPIERAIRRLLLQGSVFVLAICAVVVLVGRLHGDVWPVAIIAGVSLAMAAIPEELPMVYTLYLALGAWRLSRDRALVRRLGSVETLGATSVICVDKTGTLTFGRIELASLKTLDETNESDLLRFAMLASDPESLDPLDRAIRRYAEPLAIVAPAAADLIALEPFDARRKAATATWRIGTSSVTATKGALEVIVGVQRDAIAVEALAWGEQMAADGMRVIAVAADGLLRGVLAFADPVRPGIRESIAACRTAGIRVVMITGDHPLTASAIARSIGISTDEGAVITGDELEALTDDELERRMPTVSVVARARPEHKLRIIRAVRGSGATVAMTGDGTNDALALRDADIGIAMGERGSDVARGAADLVLLDDDFSTIVAAVRDGRRIFDNLRHAFSYLIAFHVPLLVSALVVPLLGLPLLLMPIHLVILELIVHPTSSLVFEADPGAPNIMTRPPRPRTEGLLHGVGWIRPALVGGTLSLAVLGVYLALLRAGSSADVARTTAFVTMLAGQCAIVLVERSPKAPFWRGLRVNPALLISLPLTLAMLPLAVYTPGVNAALHFTPLPLSLWALAFGSAAVSTLWFEPFKLARA
jgi:Ca2+-transporting ATPase